MSTRTLIDSIEQELRRYKAMGEGAIRQLSDEELCRPGPSNGNSMAVVVWHMSGNFASRFTDFLTTDGEKPWRRREEEFAQRTVTRDALIEKWEQGWRVVFEALAPLTDANLTDRVTIRGESWPVHGALHRALAHATYHVGQMVYLGKIVRGGDWKYLTIPPGQSDAYNQNPAFDRPERHAAGIKGPA